MDAGMEVLEGIIIFIVVGGFLFNIAPRSSWTLYGIKE